MMWYGYNGYNPMMGWGSGFGGFFQMIFGALVIAAIVILIVWLVRGSRHNLHRAMHGGSALEILNERYAKGEIDREEYEQKKKAILG